MEEGTELFLPCELEYGFGCFRVNPEIGFLVREEAEEGWEYGIALGWEVFAGLELLGEIRALVEETAVTLILVTHDPFEALALCEWAAVLEEGRVCEEGPLGELVSSGASALIKKFREFTRPLTP